MEDVLDVYEKPYNPLRPQICFDERPCYLIGNAIVPIPMEPGKPMREDYTYEKNGCCYVFIAFERHLNFRYVEIHETRTAADYAQFMKNLAKKYPFAEKIILVQDNLNTHSAGPFYEVFEPQEAFELSQKFEYHYTPIHGSWLNMAEIELSALAKQCLNRRIGDVATLKREVLSWASQRNEKKATVNWKFNKKSARIKLEKKYLLSKN